MKRITRILLGGILAYVCLWVAVVTAAMPLDRRPNQTDWVFDDAGLIEERGEDRINAFLFRLYQDADIEFLAVSVNSLGGEDINMWANRLFQNWKIGEKTNGHRGLLLVVAVAEQQVRLEVGNDLEGLLTDAFTGYIEREQMKPFFEQGRVGDGFEATLELIVSRVFKRIEDGSYDPEGKAGLGGTDYRSAGGGARQEMDIGSVSGPQKDMVGQDVRSYFSAQDTPEATLALYFEASRRHIKDPDLGIFTDETKEFFRNWTVTNAQQDSERQFDNVPYEVKTNGQYAVIYYPTKDWTFNPFFLRRSNEGWQMDFATMTRVIRFNHRNYWRFVDQDHPYMFAFADYKVDDNGFVWFKRTKAKRGYINLSFPWSTVPMEIRWVASGGSADREGIRVGDVITHINGKDVRRIGFAAAVNEAAGSVGEPLDVRVHRPSENRDIDFTIVREEERF